MSIGSFSVPFFSSPAMDEEKSGAVQPIIKDIDSRYVKGYTGGLREVYKARLKREYQYLGYCDEVLFLDLSDFVIKYTIFF